MTQTLRDISTLFFSTDPLEITDEEFEQVILPHFRAQRAKMLTTEATGARAPATKRISAPATLQLKDLDLTKLKL